MSAASSRLAVPPRRLPPIAAAVRLTVAARQGDEQPLPGSADLKAARQRLLAEYGPCAACHPDLLVATARRMAAERRRS